MKMQLAGLVTQCGVASEEEQAVITTLQISPASELEITEQRPEGDCNTQLGTCTAVGMSLAAENKDNVHK